MYFRKHCFEIISVEVFRAYRRPFSRLPVSSVIVYKVKPLLASSLSFGSTVFKIRDCVKANALFQVGEAFTERDNAIFRHFVEFNSCLVTEFALKTSRR